MKNRASLAVRIESALKNLFIADSLSMPVHWYYNTQDIYLAFEGGVTGFHDAPDFHPSSIMSLHSIQQGGRKTTSNKNLEIVGKLILKGKAKYWNRPNTHYHHLMKAGDNTLNAHCARVLIRSLLKNNGHYQAQVFIDDYIAFMTDDIPTHNDTYAESYHRGFFQNYVQGKAPDKCAAITHDTASIGGLVTIAPLVLSERFKGTSLTSVRKLCQEHLFLTHPDKKLATICDHYVLLLDQLLFADTGEDWSQFCRSALQNCAKKSVGIDLEKLDKQSNKDHQVVGMKFSTACYIEHAWPSTLFLAYRYLNDIKQGLIANANLGGDNVHRGSVLGVILGLIQGLIQGLTQGKTLDNLFGKLLAQKAIQEEIDQLLDK